MLSPASPRSDRLTVVRWLTAFWTGHHDAGRGDNGAVAAALIVPRWTHLGLLAAACFFAAMAGIELTREAGRVAAIWLSNAVLLAALLRVPTKNWPSLLAVAFAANLAANLLSGDAPGLALALGLCNTVEVLVGAIPVRRWRGPVPDLSSPAIFVGFCAWTGGVACAVSATLAATVLAATGAPFGAVWRMWFLADALGIVTGAPLLLILGRNILRVHPRPAEAVLIPLLAAAVTAGVFAQDSLPLLFLVFPALTAAAFRLGVRGAAATTLLCLVVAVLFTVHGTGPIARISLGLPERILFLQFYLAVAVFTALPIAVVLAQRAQLAASLATTAAEYRSIVETTRDVLFRTDAQGRWAYLNPSWTRMTGYDLTASLGEPTTDIIHPDDRATVAMQRARIIEGGADEYRFETRYRHADGHWCWLEARASAVRDAAGRFLGTSGTLHDVTARKEGEAAVAQSEARYRLLAEHSNDMIVRMGLDGVRRFVSPACRTLLGYRPEEMVGGQPIASIHVDDRARAVEICRTLLTGIDNQICTYRQQHRDGHYVWLEASYRLIRDTAGAPVEIVASVRDVGRRQAVENQAAETLARLQESHRLFSMASSLASLGHWRMDLVRREVSWSDEVFRIFGTAPDQVPTFTDAINAHDPADRQRVRRIIGRAVRTGSAYEYSAMLTVPGGAAKTVVVRGQAERAPSGRIVGIIGVIQDVSAQVAAQDAMRRSEQSYRLLAENATDVVLRTADDGSVVYISPSCVELSGYRPDDLVGLPCADFIHPDDHAAVHGAHVAIVTGAQGSATVEYRLRHKDGGWRWLESHMKPWRAPDGLGGGIISAIRDIERRKALEGELVAARNVAEAAVRAKSAFLANMSHEIRTPMNGVLGFTEMVLAGDLDPVQRRHVELIADSGRSMMRLLNDILDMSKIEAGMMRTAEEAVDLRHLTQRCTAMMLPLAEAKGLRLSAEVEPAIPARLVSDPLRLRQILLNLIGNAVKFTERGSVSVHAQAGEGVFQIEVCDTGIGIAPARLTSIFQRFTQADETTARSHGGSGLGLTISEQLARLMGGSIAVRSVLGKGTSFTLTLPLLDAQEEPPTTVPAFAADVIPADPQHRPRVLIAEDHDINQALILAMAQRAGMDAAIAQDGADALAQVEAATRSGQPFALVLMDLQMPNMDGLAATRQLRALGHTAAQLPIVALTANAYAEDVEACRAAGMQGHLAKPVRLRDLTDTLARHVRTGNRRTAAVESNPPEASDALVARYSNRKVDALAAMAALVDAGQCSDEDARKLAGQLHKLAGVAAFFGEDRFGELAAKLESGLGNGSEVDRMSSLEHGYKELRRAA